MSNIPEARAILAEMAPHLPEPHRGRVLSALALLYRRRPAKPPAPATKRKVTPEMAEAIRAYVSANPTAHLQDVAARFGVNLGRVSEALHHER